jgi:hypothetical protein
MAITVTLYGLTQEKAIEQVGATVDLLASDTRLSLHTDVDAPNRDTDDFFDDQTGELTGAAGYAEQTLASKTITYDSASDQVRFDCADITFSFTGANTWRYGVVRTNAAAADTAAPLYGLLTWDSNQTVSTTYTLTIDPAGLFYWDTT